MAITYAGTKNSLSANQLPVGYTKPVVVDFADFEYVRTVKLVVAKATVQNADPALTMQNILADATIGLNKQVTDILAADYLGTATVSAFGDMVALGNNVQSMLKGSAAYTAAAIVFEATVNIYVKAL